MIANLSSFIEFMAAIYVTMSIDNLIAKRFWTRDYETLLGSLFLKWRIPYISKTSTDQTDDIEDLQKTEEVLSRRRGLLMLTACVCLLIYIGLEPKTDYMSMQERSYLYFSLDVVYLYLLTAFFLDHVFLSNKWMVSFSIIGIPVIFFLCECLKCNFSPDSISPFWIIVLSQTSLYTIIVLLLPAFWQLIRNWLFSRKNMVRIQYLLKDELERLNKAQEYADGVDINTIAEWYRNDAVKKLKANGTEDTISGLLIQTFNTKLREIIKKPRVRDIIPYIHKVELENIENITPSIVYSEAVDDAFNNLCVKYEAIKKKPPLEDFAKANKVNPNELKSYYSKWIIRNKRP